MLLFVVVVDYFPSIRKWILLPSFLISTVTFGRKLAACCCCWNVRLNENTGNKQRRRVMYLLISLSLYSLLISFLFFLVLFLLWLLLLLNLFIYFLSIFNIFIFYFFTIVYFYYIDTSVLLENIPLLKFIKTTFGTRVVYFP